MAALLVASLWWVKLFEWFFAWDFHTLGVFPLKISGVIGIILGPLLHGSWEHLIGNSLPMLLLSTLLFYGYPKSRWWTLVNIWLFSGLGVWLFGRESYHLGASGLAHGLFFYLFIGGILRRDKRSSALLMVAFYLYGSMLLTILPREPEISFEYHLFGALSGIVCALIFRHWDPKLVEKTYAWEEPADLTPALDDDGIIGEQWKIIASPPPETANSTTATATDSEDSFR